MRRCDGRAGSSRRARSPRRARRPRGPPDRRAARGPPRAGRDIRPRRGSPGDARPLRAGGDLAQQVLQCVDRLAAPTRRGRTCPRPRRSRRGRSPTSPAATTTRAVRPMPATTRLEGLRDRRGPWSRGRHLAHRHDTPPVNASSSSSGSCRRDATPWPRPWPAADAAAHRIRCCPWPPCFAGAGAGVASSGAAVASVASASGPEPPRVGRPRASAAPQASGASATAASAAAAPRRRLRGVRVDVGGGVSWTATSSLRRPRPWARCASPSWACWSRRTSPPPPDRRGAGRCDGASPAAGPPSRGWSSSSTGRGRRGPGTATRRTTTAIGSNRIRRRWLSGMFGVKESSVNSSCDSA